jgi:hypothetical protein
MLLLITSLFFQFLVKIKEAVYDRFPPDALTSSVTMLGEPKVDIGTCIVSSKWLSSS